MIARILKFVPTLTSVFLLACASGGGASNDDDVPDTTDAPSESGSADDTSAGGASAGAGGAAGGGVSTGPGDPIGFAFVGTSKGDDLIIAELATNTSMAAISLLPAGDYPYDATMNPDGSEVWIVGAVSDGVAIVSTVTNTLTNTIDLAGVADYPVDVAFSPDGAQAYVSSRDSGVIAVIDTTSNSVVHTVALPSGRKGGKMAVDPCTGIIFVTDWHGSYLMTVDTIAAWSTQFPMGDALWDLAIDASGQHLYVADRGSNELHIVDTSTKSVVDSVLVGDDPWGVDITPDGATVVVATEDDGTAWLINTATLTASSVTLPADAEPRDVEISADGWYAYVPSGDLPGSDALYAVDLSDQTVNVIDVGDSNPNVVAVAPPLTCAP
jgi:YVTN family beta-propeller protein